MREKRSRKGAEKRDVEGKSKAILDMNKAVLDLIRKDGNITQTAIMLKLNISRKQVQSSIKALENSNIIMKEGSSRRATGKCRNTGRVNQA